MTPFTPSTARQVLRTAAACLLLLMAELPAAQLVHAGGSAPLAGIDTPEPAVAEGDVVPRAADGLTPVIMSTLRPPQPFLGTDGLWRLVYELILTNTSATSITLDSLEVRSADESKRVVAKLLPPDFADRLQLLGATHGSSELGPSQAAALLLEVTFKTRDEVPATLEHHIVLTEAQPSALSSGGGPVSEVGAEVAVDATPVPVISPPLEGSNWVAFEGCCLGHHNRTVLGLNGKLSVGQRSAIDYMRLDDQRRLVVGNVLRNESYPGYGQTVLAVQDATVVSTLDGLADQVPTQGTPVTLQTVTGNEVTLDLGNSRFAFYGHLKPGSLRVKPGDRVRRGQVLALVGNTGNTTAPHLHFQLMDGPSALASEGIPYVMDSFTLVGVANANDPSVEALFSGGPAPIIPAQANDVRTGQLPLGLAIVTFPTAPA